jgi:uroporphyrin-III C-methyltransferase / precorrin-2 dehydrogenase / sirohydrochlorin ferrochelatase
MHSLPLFVRLTGRNVILIGTGEAAAAKRRLLERAGAVIVGEAGEAALAIVAVEEDAEAEASVARLKARGIFVNAVDRVALCDFTLPAILDRDPVLIAIGTGGASAGLAKALRQRLETLLPQSLGALATGLSAARGALRSKYSNSTRRREAIDAALQEGGALDPFVTGGDVAAWLATDAAVQPDRTETLVFTSDDPDDLTLRQARQLASATTIYHDPDVPAAILDRARADATRIEGPAPERPGSGLTLIVSR